MRRNQRSADAQAYRPLYKTARWQAVRRYQLAKHPLCQWCEKQGRITAATVCHHDNPEDKASPATFYRGPFTSLCAPCHDGEAQSTEARGYSTRIGEDGWPVDERHPAYLR